MPDLTPISGRFAGSTVIVTGAGSGIGRATAERLIAEGAAVVASDIRQERLDGVTADLGDSLVPVAGDVADPETIARLLSAAGGRVDGLANVAGIMDRFLPPAEVDDATWDRVFAVNLTGPMRLTRAVLPVMVERGTGSIVNVSSEAGLRGSCAGAAYTASKHALNGLTKSTAFFYGPKGVRCNAVAPGAVATNIEAPFGSEWAQQRLGPLLQTNVPGVAQAAELAAAITWLLSGDSSNVNGVILPDDGGWSAV